MAEVESKSMLPNSWVNVEWSAITATDGFRRGPFGGNLKKSCFVDEGAILYTNNMHLSMMIAPLLGILSMKKSIQS